MRTDMRRPFVNQLNVAALLQLRVVTIHINGVTRPEKVNFQKSITYIMRLKLLYISPLPPAVAFLMGQWVYHPLHLESCRVLVFLRIHEYTLTNKFV